VRDALRAGLPIVCSTDAHPIRGLENMALAVHTARRGGATGVDEFDTRPSCFSERAHGLRRMRWRFALMDTLPVCVANADGSTNVWFNGWAVRLVRNGRPKLLGRQPPPAAGGDPTLTFEWGEPNANGVAYVRYQDWLVFLPGPDSSLVASVDPVEPHRPRLPRIYRSS
jgi:hypothetical protein